MMKSPDNSPDSRKTAQPARFGKARLLICCALVTGSAILLLSSLGHSALWDDECYTALEAACVSRTGDTTAELDHNIVANGNGFKLRNMRQRFLPPLASYLAAPFIGLMGQTAFAARLPFALCGIAAVGLICRWMLRANADLRTCLVMSIAVLANVSLMLYLRQCRYYAPAILFCTAAAYLYLRWDGRLSVLPAIALLLVGVLGSNYLIYLAFAGSIFVDYFIWGRRERSIDWRGWLLLVLPQVLLGALIIYIWNPIGKSLHDYQRTDFLGEHLRLLWWNLRDLNTCEFGVGILIAAAPFLYFLKRDKWLLRGPLAIFVYCLVVAFISPQPAPSHLKNHAELRYLAPLIPLCIFVGARVILTVTQRARFLAIPLALLAFGTNFLTGGPYAGGSQYMYGRNLPPKTFGSTFVQFVGELIDPPPSAFRAAADWVNENVEYGQSVWTPSGAKYPLMYHAPKALYAWQLKWPPEEQFKGLERIHFEGRGKPDYIIAFGPNVGKALPYVQPRRDGGQAEYRFVHHIPLYYYDLSRPELFWHAFKKVTDFNPRGEGVFIFERVFPPMGSGQAGSGRSPTDAG